MKLPIVSGSQIIKLLQKEGFSITRQKGSHISLHKEINNKIMKQAGMTREEFLSKI